MIDDRMDELRGLLLDCFCLLHADGQLAAPPGYKAKKWMDLLRDLRKEFGIKEEQNGQDQPHPAKS